jgi:hypothetical protein
MEASAENDVSRTSSEPDTIHYLKTYPFWFKTIKTLEALSYVVIIAGIAIFFIQQHEEFEKTRLTATLDYVGRFNSDYLANFRYRLLAPWYDYADDLTTIEQIGQVQRSTLEAFVMKLVDKYTEEGGQKDLRPAVFAVVDFYDQLIICDENQICDRNTLRAYFSANAKNFFCLYRPLIEFHRSRMAIPDYGKRLEQLVGSLGGC